MQIKVTQAFLKSAKPLAKKYRSFNQDYQNLLDELEKNPKSGTDLGDGFHKVRMAIESKGKGKSGGCRVITLDTLLKNDTLYLMEIYDKSDSESIKIGVLKERARQLGMMD